MNTYLTVKEYHSVALKEGTHSVPFPSPLQASLRRPSKPPCFDPNSQHKRERGGAPFALVALPRVRFKSLFLSDVVVSYGAIDRCIGTSPRLLAAHVRYVVGDSRRKQP